MQQKVSSNNRLALILYLIFNTIQQLGKSGNIGEGKAFSRTFDASPLEINTLAEIKGEPKGKEKPWIFERASRNS